MDEDEVEVPLVEQLESATACIVEREEECVRLEAETKRLREIVAFLFARLDDIDTYDDMVREDDRSYRILARKAQKRRWETGIMTDGYTLWLADGTVIEQGEGEPLGFNGGPQPGAAPPAEEADG